MRKVWFAVAVLVVLVAGGIAYQSLTSNQARSQVQGGSAQGGPPPAVPVVIAIAKRQSAPVLLDSVGAVQTIASVAVKSRVDGAIDKVLVTDGQSVKTGDVLFQIDPRLAQAQVDQAEAQVARDRANLVNAQRDVKRYEPLAEKEFVSRQQLDTSTTTAQANSAVVRADQAALDNARVQLSYFTIKAPIDGRLGYINQKVGNDLKANDVPLATLNQIKPIYVNFPLPQADLPAVREAMATGAVEIDALPAGATGAPEKGRLTFFENSIDSTTGTIQMRATFDNPQERLWPGEFVTVTVDLRVQQDALTVPQVAVQIGQKEDYVYVVKADNTVEYRPVIVNRTVDGNSVISKGLEVGERVVTDGQLRLVQGSRVTIHADKDAAKPGAAS
jgi:membrane fusion protein, multidrug efflux system